MQHIQTSSNFSVSLVCVCLLPWCLPLRTLNVSDLIYDQMSRSPFDPTKTNSEHCKRFAETVNQLSSRRCSPHAISEALLTRSRFASVCVWLPVKIGHRLGCHTHSPTPPGWQSAPSLPPLRALHGFSLIDPNEFGELRHGSKCTGNGSPPPPRPPARYTR